jgi:hypothetical protein
VGGGGRIACIILGVLLAPAGSPRADTQDPIRFDLPLACRMGAVCHIQNYVDQDPGPGRRDYACGRLTYDGDEGTDFRLPDYVMMAEGVEVRAAAPGIVQRVRDGVADISIREGGIDRIKGREAGNGVVVDHGGGWTTQYSHLRRDSVRVKTGDRVETGQVLGLVGLSGNTEFPHVEFKVRKDGRVVDPFVGPDPVTTCTAPRRPLWTEAALSQLDYQPTGLLVSGLSAERPEPEAARRGRHRLPDRVAAPNALVLWVDIFGVMEGDQERFVITGPDGAVLRDQAIPVERSMVSWFRFNGIRPPEGGWKPGFYRAAYTLTRNGAPVVSVERAIEITP